MLAGRTVEVQRLRRMIALGESVCVVEGEPGVGKSSVVAAALRGTDQAILIGRCDRMVEPLPLAPLIEALTAIARPPTRLSPLLGALRPLLPEFGVWLPPDPPGLSDVGQERLRRFRAIREMLGAIAPVVLVLEDVHWIDAVSRELLRFLVPRVPSGVTLILTRCGPTFAVAGARAITVAPLADGTHPDSGGLPLLSRLLDAREELAAIRWVDERIKEHGAEVRAVVHAAAILREPAPAELLAHVAGLPATRVGRALSRALEQSLLVASPSGYVARHPLTEQTIPIPVRQELRARAAQAVHGVTRQLIAEVPNPSDRRASRRGRRGYGQRLSPREVEVAGLVSQGLGNREIAQKLFLSRRTVEVHVRNALRKLEFTSRRDIELAFIKMK